MSFFVLTVTIGVSRRILKIAGLAQIRSSKGRHLAGCWPVAFDIVSAVGGLSQTDVFQQTLRRCVGEAITGKKSVVLFVGTEKLEKHYGTEKNRLYGLWLRCGCQHGACRNGCPCGADPSERDPGES